MDVPVVSKDWAHFSTTLAVDASAADSRTGTLTVRLLNYGTLPVYFDSLTVRQSAPGVFIAQEQHYYPFGMNMSGVAVNTQPAGATSKQQYNGGSELEDGLLDAESGNYSTPCRRYDPTLGRFLGVDPLADKYADYSPYNFAFNDPANLNDPSGADALGDLATSNAALTGEGTTIPSMGDGAGGHGETGRQDGDKPQYRYMTDSNGTIKRDNFPLGRGGDPGGAAAASGGGGGARGSEGGNVLGAGTLSFGGGANWQSFTKANLREYYSANNGGRVGTENDLGRTFENIFSRFTQEQWQPDWNVTSNTKLFSTEPVIRNTVPDFRGTGFYMSKADGRISIPGGAWYEAKAKDGGLYLSSNQSQMKGHIDNLAYSMRAAIAEYNGFSPTLTLVTTAGVPFSPGIANYASVKGITYRHIVAQYRHVGGKIQFDFKLLNRGTETPFMLNGR